MFGYFITTARKPSNILFIRLPLTLKHNLHVLCIKHVLTYYFTNVDKYFCSPSQVETAASPDQMLIVLLTLVSLTLYYISSAALAQLTAKNMDRKQAV